MPTAIVFDDGRQSGLRAKFDFTYDQLTSGTYADMIKLPVGAIVTKADVVITTLFNSATTDKFSIGDKPAGGAARDTQYSAQSADVTAVPTVISGTMTGAKYNAGGTIGVRWDGAGGATSAGAGTLFVEYVIDGRATEVQDR